MVSAGPQLLSNIDSELASAADTTYEHQLLSHSWQLWTFPERNVPPRSRLWWSEGGTDSSAPGTILEGTKFSLWLMDGLKRKARTFLKNGSQFYHPRRKYSRCPKGAFFDARKSNKRDPKTSTGAVPTWPCRWRVLQRSNAQWSGSA